MHKPNKVKKVFFAAVCAALLSACTIEHDFKPDSNTEYTPITLKISIIDGDGNDLLDTTSERFSGKQVTVKFKGSQYKINYPYDSIIARDYKQVPIKKSQESGKYCITFDNVDGAKNYDDDFLVIWKLKHPEANLPVTQIDYIHLKHIFIKGTPYTKWLFNLQETGLDTTAVEFSLTKNF